MIQARVLTGTKAQMTTAASRIDALLGLPDGSGTVTWAEPELLDDGVTWALRVPLKPRLVRLRERVQTEGIDAVLAGTGVTKAQASALLDAIRDATERRTKREADSD